MANQDIITDGDFVEVLDGEFRGEVATVIGTVEFEKPMLIVKLDNGLQTTIETSLLKLL